MWCNGTTLIYMPQKLYQAAATWTILASTGKSQVIGCQRWNNPFIGLNWICPLMYFSTRKKMRIWWKKIIKVREVIWTGGRKAGAVISNAEYDTDVIDLHKQVSSVGSCESLSLLFNNHNCQWKSIWHYVFLLDVVVTGDQMKPTVVCMNAIYTFGIR